MIKVYGIPADVWKCYACRSAEKILSDNNIPYEFIPVLHKKLGEFGEQDIGFEYDRPVIVDMAQRAGFDSLRITYPVVFDDDQFIGGYKKMLSYLVHMGWISEDEADYPA